MYLSRRCTPPFPSATARMLCTPRPETVNIIADVVAEILVAERFDSLPTAEKARLHLRLMTMALWYGCDLSDLQLLEFSSDGNDDLSFHGQVIKWK